MNKADKIHINDKYMPCLLMKICDQNPQRQEEQYTRGISISQLREDILRNIRMILNSSSHPSAEELGSSPEISSSVICMGLNDFCGCSYSKAKQLELQQMICRQLRMFEPRLIPETIEVKIINSPLISKSTVGMEIHGRIQAAELNEEEIFCSFLSLESGDVAVSYKTGR